MLLTTVQRLSQRFGHAAGSCAVRFDVMRRRQNGFSAVAGREGSSVLKNPKKSAAGALGALANIQRHTMQTFIPRCKFAPPIIGSLKRLSRQASWLAARGRRLKRFWFDLELLKETSGCRERV